MEPRPDPGPADVGHAERPLGRGLKDVSHLFLSQRVDGGPGDTAPDPGWRVERPSPRQESAPGAFLLRPAAQATREQIAAVLREFEGALEEGLRAIDAELPCAPHGEIDLLAIDRASQLTIVDFETMPSDDILIRGLGHLDWVVQNLPNVRRMYRGHSINFSRQPRLFLVAPGFSSRVRRVGRQIGSPRIDWVRYHFVETPGRPGVFFERVCEE
jgi:hypothetical protein